jgi:putative lipoprotein
MVTEVWMPSKLRRLLGFLLVVFAVAIGPAAAAKVTLTGEVTYRERIALPAGSSLRVRLIDLTALGTPTRVEAAAPITTPGQVPLTFTLNFDDSTINPDHRHAVIAEISVGIELWFRNSTPYEVAPLAPAEAITIVADFVGRRTPAPQPQPAAPQPEPPSVESLLGQNWRATAIRGEPTTSGIDSTLSVTSELRAGGRGGCNNYFAQAAINGGSLRFSTVGSTMMACLSEEAAAQEDLFFAALEATRFWRLDGENLLLLGTEGRELVRFERAAR